MTRSGDEIAFPEVVRERFLNTQRADVRRKAAASAAALIRNERSWSADNLHVLLQHLQTDWFNGKVLRNRFSPGLAGQHERWLLESLDQVGAWLLQVRAAPAVLDDDTVRRLLRDFWQADVKGPYVFPTAVLAALAPDQYLVYTKPTVRTMNVLDPSLPAKRKQDAESYLATCRKVREACAKEHWPLCLADSALHLDPDAAGAEPAVEFRGYTAEAVSFLRSLPEHTRDPAWHHLHKETFQTSLRDPTDALVHTIASRFLAALDAEVAEPRRPMSVLKKNDYGGDGYHAHFWFAFFDPAASSKTESVQLFLVLEGDGDYVRYGVGVGHAGRPYHERLLAAVRAAPAAAASFFDALPDGFEIRLRYRDRERTMRPAELVSALRGGAIDAVLDEAGLESLDVQRKVAPLDTLVERGADLASDIGGAFVTLWPLFQAARTGVLEAKRQIVEITDREGEQADEDAPASLSDLSTLTSVSETLLAEIDEALRLRGQAILVGPPGTSKTYLAEQFAHYFVRYQPGLRPQGQARVIYMHASWAYEDFFEGIRPKVGGTGLEFVAHRGTFFAWVEDVVKKGPAGARYVLVLDEINRCDTAAVLGELLQLMEYRGKPTTLLSGRPFTLPRNLYLLGTMNSADRSIGRLDLALRRRFLFIDLLPNDDILQTWLEASEGRNPAGFRAEMLRRCNDWLEQNHGITRDQQIGHALFMPSDGVLTSPVLRQIVRYSVLPYVRELLTERGRDATAALEQVVGHFASCWATAADEDEDAE